jgi:hypothetical protein
VWKYLRLSSRCGRKKAQGGIVLMIKSEFGPLERRVKGHALQTVAMYIREGAKLACMMAFNLKWMREGGKWRSYAGTLTERTISRTRLVNHSPTPVYTQRNPVQSRQRVALQNLSLLRDKASGRVYQLCCRARSRCVLPEGLELSGPSMHCPARLIRPTLRPGCSLRRQSD